MDGKIPAISFIIPAYNEELLLARTLNSIRKSIDSAHIEAEIIVVDNNSSDKTSEIAKSSGADKVVFEPVNNISRARNTGGKAASGELLVFIDADTCIDEKLLKELISYNHATMVCGGGARLAFDAPMPHAARFSTWLWNKLAPRFGLAAGSFSFCSKNAFKELGGFNETLYAAEDVAFSKKLKAWGRKRNLLFVILKSEAESSARRVVGRSVWPLFIKMLSLAIMPWKLRSKKHCSIWYDHTTRQG